MIMQVGITAIIVYVAYRWGVGKNKQTSLS
jgi:hypothetical protein